MSLWWFAEIETKEEFKTAFSKKVKKLCDYFKM